MQQRAVKIINKGLYADVRRLRVLMITAEEFIRQAYSSLLNYVSEVGSCYSIYITCLPGNKPLVQGHPIVMSVQMLRLRDVALFCFQAPHDTGSASSLSLFLMLSCSSSLSLIAVT